MTDSLSACTLLVPVLLWKSSVKSRVAAEHRASMSLVLPRNGLSG